ncbi:MAG: redoxin domain-containing protein [Planctomycetota bacterium]
MAIRQGDAAQPFELPHAPGEKVNLADEFGKEKVVLLFIPLAFSPVCTTEMCHMRDEWSKWEGMNAKVYGVSVDSPFVTAKFRESENLPFPILSDFNKEMSSAYGCIHEDLVGLKGVSKRSAFVVGTDGKVAYCWISDDPKQQPNYEEVKAAVESAP